ncbi:MAG: hypothetical protein K0Q52_609 [Microbacterium sp.]|jgi:hypothetical protein|nr:hypothetical protein [Microbacterium sp.]
MSDAQTFPDEEPTIDAEGTDPDLVSTDDTSPGEEEDDDIDLEDLP